MNDQPLPTYLNRGFSLSDAELRTQLGAELLSLCQSVTADEYREVHRVVEGALPFEARQQARAARLEAESANLDRSDRGSPGRRSRIGLIVAMVVALGAAVAFFSR